MAAFNTIGPWVTAGTLLAVVIFFCCFYIVRLFKVRKMAATTDAILQPAISIEQKKKLKEEIVHDIVEDITPVLKKRLEKAF